MPNVFENFYALSYIAFLVPMNVDRAYVSHSKAIKVSF